MAEQQQARIWKKALHLQDSCPEPEELHALLDNFNEAADSPLGKHASACLHCSAELELMRKVTAAEADEEEEEAVQRMVGKLRERSGEIFQQAVPVEGREFEAMGSKGQGWRLWEWLISAPGLTALASAVLVVALLGGIWLNRDTAAPLVAPEGSPPVLRSARIVQLVPSGDLAQPPERFFWQAVEGASKYQVQVFEVDQNEIWSGESSGSNLLLPRALRDKIVPGKRLIWQVTALDAQGRRLATSSQTGFRIQVH